MAYTDVIASRATGAVQIDKVLRNTYMLLGMTLAFSALMAGVSMAMGAPYLGPIITLVGFFGLVFAVHKTAESSLGLLFTPADRLHGLHPRPHSQRLPQPRQRP